MSITQIINGTIPIVSKLEDTGENSIFIPKEGICTLYEDNYVYVLIMDGAKPMVASRSTVINNEWYHEFAPNVLARPLRYGNGYGIHLYFCQYNNKEWYTPNHQGLYNLNYKKDLTILEVWGHIHQWDQLLVSTRWCGHSVLNSGNVTEIYSQTPQERQLYKGSGESMALIPPLINPQNIHALNTGDTFTVLQFTNTTNLFKWSGRYSPINTEVLVIAWEQIHIVHHNNGLWDASRQKSALCTQNGWVEVGARTLKDYINVSDPNDLRASMYVDQYGNTISKETFIQLILQKELPHSNDIVNIDDLSYIQTVDKNPTLEILYKAGYTDIVRALYQVMAKLKIKLSSEDLATYMENMSDISIHWTGTNPGQILGLPKSILHLIQKVPQWQTVLTNKNIMNTINKMGWSVHNNSEELRKLYSVLATWSCHGMLGILTPIPMQQKTIVSILFNNLQECNSTYYRDYMKGWWRYAGALNKTEFKDFLCQYPLKMNTSRIHNIPTTLHGTDPFIIGHIIESEFYHDKLNTFFQKAKEKANAILHRADELKYSQQIEKIQSYVFKNKDFSIFPLRTVYSVSGEDNTNSFSIEGEGGYMHHCLYNFYKDSLIEGSYQAFVLRLNEQIGRPYVTIGVRDGYIDQAYQKYDHPITDQQKDMINTWVKSLKQKGINISIKNSLCIN